MNGSLVRRSILFCLIGYSIFKKCSREGMIYVHIVVLVASVYLVMCSSE